MTRAAGLAVDYDASVAWLYSLSAHGIRPGLARVREVAERLGSPHVGPTFVQVAGTNGKGSTSAMIASILRRSGLRTGLYTSPHLHRFVERVRRDGRVLGRARLARIATRLRAALEAPGAPAITFFEAATLIAFDALSGCDVVVLEVGLGGRLDATSIATPAVGVVTPISLDHEAWLGRTLREVAREKAAIVRDGAFAVVGRQPPEARRVLLARARAVGAPTWRLGRDFGADSAGTRARLWAPGLEVEARLPLRGAHQRDNAACALAAVVALGVDVGPEQVVRGLERVRWPGRLEVVARRPLVLLDAAHNPGGAACLAAHLRARPGPRTALIFGAMDDKDAAGMLCALDDVADLRLYVRPPVTRGTFAPEELARIRPGRVARGVGDAVARARRAVGPDGRVVVAGSLFLVAEVRRRLLRVDADPPIRL